MAGHLASAFAIYSGLVWTTLSVAVPFPPSVGAGPAGAAAARALARWAHPLAALVGLTAMSGCFVAGKDAGRAYNTWPDMNGEWVPSEYWSDRLPGGWVGRAMWEGGALGVLCVGWWIGGCENDWDRHVTPNHHCSPLPPTINQRHKQSAPSACRSPAQPV